MTPAKRRPATPAGKGPTRAAPAPEVPPVADPPPPPEVSTVVDPPPVPAPPTPGGVRAPDIPTAPPDAPVPDELVIAPVPPAETKDSAQEAPTGEAGGDSAPPTETGQVEPEDQETPKSPRRSRAQPLPVRPA